MMQWRFAVSIVDEFGEDGRRCVEFLETAHVLLCGGFRSVPRWGQTVAYCLREAMTAVLEAARLGDAGRWNEVSRGVVAAGREYRRAEDDPGPERDRLLGVLLARIDDLEGFHREERLRRRRLNDVMVNLTGAAPLSARVAPVDAYQGLCVRLNNIVHRPDGGVDVEGLWSECLATLRLLFLPPDIRFAELEELARIERLLLLGALRSETLTPASAVVRRWPMARTGGILPARGWRCSGRGE